MRRRAWIAIIVVVVLLAGAFVAGELIARAVIRDRVEQALRGAGVETAAPVDVGIPGLVLPQLAGGRIGEATVSAPGVTVQDITADVQVELRGVDIHARTAEEATAEADLDAAALQALIRRAGEGTAWQMLGDEAEVAIAEPHVQVSGTVPVLGAALPLALTLTPSAQDGLLELAPDRLSVGEWQVERDDLDALPYGVPEALSRPIPVCVAAALPRGVVLERVRVEGDRLIAGFGVDGAILSDPSTRVPGDCAQR